MSWLLEDEAQPKKTDAGRVPIARIIERLDACYAKNDGEGAGRLLIYWLGEAKRLSDLDGELSLQNEMVGHCRKQGDREGAFAAVARAMELLQLLRQSETVSGATILLNCATAKKAFGDAAGAVELFSRTLAVYRRELPAEDVRFGGLYNNMALALVDVAEFEAARSAYFEAIRVTEAAGRVAETAVTYVNLAHFYELVGEGERIAAALDRAKELLEDPRIPHDGYYAFVLEKCAPSFDYFGDAALAARLMEEAKKIYEGT